MDQSSSLWQAVLGEIELSVSQGSYITWFKSTKLLEQDKNKLVIGVPNVFFKQQMELRFNDLIVNVLKKNGVDAPQVEYRIHSGLTTKRSAQDGHQAQAVAGLQAGTGPASAAHSGIGSNDWRQGLNQRYTFDNFIVGSGNELAHAACQAVAGRPGRKYNPLFIYGGVGIGKTHLIQAVGNEILKQGPSKKVVYITSEQFLKEFVEALRAKKIPEFTNYYRSTDMLIIDDIQFIAGKEKAQEEFFHTFNTLHQANRQIILSSDRPPRDISTLEERLKSRFAWGMSIDMQAPDFETRCAILQTKAQDQGVDLTADVVEYLATNISTNIRELEGALNRVLAWCEMRELAPTLGIATSLLGASASRPKHISARQIIERTARHFQLPVEDILGPKRDKDIVMPRQIAMYMLRSELHMSFPKIARELGRKDHTTAIHSVDKIEKQMHLDNDVRSWISNIKERLYA